jgi:hypothetical protein
MIIPVDVQPDGDGEVPDNAPGNRDVCPTDDEDPGADAGSRDGVTIQVDPDAVRAQDQAIGAAHKIVIELQVAGDRRPAQVVGSYAADRTHRQ